MSSIAARFGQRVRKLRQKHRLSQVEMAHRFGIDRGHISDLERRKKNVCLPMLEVLSKGIRNQCFGIDARSIVRKNLPNVKHPGWNRDALQNHLGAQSNGNR